MSWIPPVRVPPNEVPESISLWKSMNDRKDGMNNKYLIARMFYDETVIYHCALIDTHLLVIVDKRGGKGIEGD
jgi:hypothetical protein